MADQRPVTVLRGGHGWTDGRDGDDDRPRWPAMVGRDVTFRVAARARRPGRGHPRGRGAGGLERPWPAGARDVRSPPPPGRVLGVAGVDGNGQSELAECICGLRRSTARTGAARDARHHRAPAPRAVIEAGVGYIPADRQRAAWSSIDIGENLMLRRHDRRAVRRATDCSAVERPRARDRWSRRFDVRARASIQRGAHLSGGNQQKVVLAREVGRRGRASWWRRSRPGGWTSGATEYVQSALLGQRERGAAILYMSTELEEVLALSDRVAVIFPGRVTSWTRHRSRRHAEGWGC